ncbi:MAG: T9SS type A sorting domain-containing protein [bacterium]
MKNFLIIFLFSWVKLVFAQDYQNICTPGTTFFQGNDGYFKAFRLDSQELPGSSDTIFYSYRAIRDSTLFPFDCRDTSNGDALGRKTWKRHDGWFWFFNKKNDTIKINSQAAVNQSWKYCSLPGNGYLQATVSAIITDSVAGTTDLVKVIFFQAKNASGNNMSGIFNQKEIKLSQHYGLSKVYDIYHTPFDTLELVLIGKTSPLLGIQPFTWADVYDFNIGDEFHYSGHDTYSAGATVQWKSIKKILGKTVYGNSDSVHYRVEECKKRWYPVPPPNTSSMHDTLVESYNFILLASEEAISMLPDEFQRHEMQAAACSRRFSEFNHRQEQVYDVNGYQWDWTNGCFSDPFELWGPVSHYAPGLGLTNWIYQLADVTVEEHTSDLVYFRKATEVWGTQVATDCSILLGTEEKVSSPGPSIGVIPNPAETEVRIQLDNFRPEKSFRFSLYDYSGEKVRDGNFTSKTFTINRDGLAPGLYLLVITDADGRITGSNKISFR